MNSIFQKIASVIFFTGILSGMVQARLPKQAQPLIKHRATKRFLNRLHDLEWLGTTNVRICIEESMVAWHEAKTIQEKEKVTETLRRQLNKALTNARQVPSWVTFEAIENISMRDVFLGFSVLELKRMAKVGAGCATAALILYLTQKKLKKIGSQISKDINTKIENLNKIVTQITTAPSRTLGATAEAVTAIPREVANSLVTNGFCFGNYVYRSINGLWKKRPVNKSDGLRIEPTFSPTSEEGNNTPEDQSFNSFVVLHRPVSQGLGADWDDVSQQELEDILRAPETDSR